MIQFDEFLNVANDIYRSLNIPDTSTMSRRSIKNIERNLLRNPQTIKDLVDEELTNYDFSENTEGEITEFRKAVIEELQYMIGEATENYYRHNQLLTEHAYSAIVDVLKNTDIPNVVDVDNDYEPSDPSVGIYDDDRTISITLSNGVIITFNVEFDDSNL